MIERRTLAGLVFLTASSLLAQPRLPDLAVASTRVREGRVTAVIANRGAVAPSVRPTTTLFVFVQGHPTRSFDAVTPALAPGATAEIAFDAIVPPGAIFQVMVDSDRRIEESDETNNRTRNQTIPASVRIDATLARHARGTRIPPLADGLARPVAATRFPSGNVVLFIENELLLTTKNAAEAEALASRHGGKVVRTIELPAATNRGSMFVIRVKTDEAPVDAITAAENGFAFSSAAGRNLAAIAAHECRSGTRASMNVVIPPAGLFEKKTIEGAGNDGLSLDYMQTGGLYDVDVASAWKALFVAGKTASKPILIGIVDSGFSVGTPGFTESDVDVAVPIATGSPNPVSCAGGACPWHGQNVAEAAAGIADDTRGVTGPAGPVARLVLVDRQGTSDHALWAILQASINGSRIINMSFAGKIERDKHFWEGAWLNWLEDMEAVTVALNNGGILLFAAAGNEGDNVDATDDDGDERFWHYPCENQGVICVGGWHDNPTSNIAGQVPAPKSNFSFSLGEFVDIWGPWTTMVGDDPSLPGPNAFMPFNGTSAATPFVSGVAALIWAANPNLSNAQVWNLMNKHAIQGGPLVRRVHAYRAVLEALKSTGINSAPVAKIVSPGNGAKLTQAGPTNLMVTAYDVEDENCCTAQWTINGDFAGTGKTVKHEFGKDPLGAKTITVVLTDSAGAQSAPVSVTATLQNQPPAIKITSVPASMKQSQQAMFKAEVVDDTTAIPVADASACPSVKWTSDKDAGVLATGCNPHIAFATPGTRTVTASYVDAHGAKSSDSRTVTVDAVAKTQLITSIIHPKDGSSFQPDAFIPVHAQMLNIQGTLTKFWILASESEGTARIVTLKNVNGNDGFRLADVFPELDHSGGEELFTLHLILSTSTGQTASASVKIGQLAFVK